MSSTTIHAAYAKWSTMVDHANAVAESRRAAVDDLYHASWRAIGARVHLFELMDLAQDAARATELYRLANYDREEQLARIESMRQEAMIDAQKYRDHLIHG